MQKQDSLMRFRFWNVRRRLTGSDKRGIEYRLLAAYREYKNRHTGNGEEET